MKLKLSTKCSAFMYENIFSESYEGERNDGRETKRCRLLSAGDTSATNARLAGVYPSSVVTSSGLFVTFILHFAVLLFLTNSLH